MNNMKTYAGIEDQYAQLVTAETVLIPVPYDGTSTWQKGADKGPQAFLEASENMELFDIETNSEVYKTGIFLADAVTENESPEKMVEAVYSTVKSYLKKGKFTTIFGGEHSVSIGSIRAHNEQFENLTVLQLDAHADLRKEYDGSACNHACALYEANNTTNLVQVGIRSMDVSEKKVMNTDNVFFAHDMINEDYWDDAAIELMTDNVYITIDLDAFDPSILSSTGTPEPGGMLWYETLEFIKKVFQQKKVVGFDIVELCPNKINKSSDFLAAKLYYKMLSYKYFSGEDNLDYDNIKFKSETELKKAKFNEDFEDGI